MISAVMAVRIVIKIAGLLVIHNDVVLLLFPRRHGFILGPKIRKFGNALLWNFLLLHSLKLSFLLLFVM
jgi:hypothetical protein